MTIVSRLLLVPGGGGSGAAHWHHRWAADDLRCRWVDQHNWHGGTRSDWVETLDQVVGESDEPTVLVAHSLGCVVVAHWAAQPREQVVGALLVAPADIDDEWVDAGSVYEPFRPIPLEPLPFAARIVASTDDPLLSVERAKVLGDAWEAPVDFVGAHLHLGSDAALGAWPEGRRQLDLLVAAIDASGQDSTA